MKQKMTAVDVRALVLLLKKKLMGLRLANVYDVSGRLYLLKLSKANRKEFLLIESGIRIHTTEFLRNKKDVPSGFSMKLRKHLRTKKLENLEQLGVDRVIDLTFGKGENAYHILVELYAQGNVILTNHEYTILSLLRSHKFDETSKIQIREKYPFTAAAGMSIDSVFVAPEDIQRFIEGEPEKEEQVEQVSEEVNEENKEIKKAGGNKQQQKQDKKAKQGKQQDKKKDINLKSILTKMVPYINFPYAEHVLKLLNLDPNAKATLEHQDVLIQAAKDCQKLVKDLETSDDIKGYLIYQDKPQQERKIPVFQTQKADALPQQEELQEQPSAQDQKFKDKLLKDFGPIPLAQFKDEPYLEYESFDQCVDEYFSQLDKQRESSKFTNKEDEIWKKMSRIKDDQEKRIQGLKKEQDLSEFKAQLLQKYIYETQAIIDILQVMQTSGISWNDITRMVKEEKKANNALANMIQKINFEKNSVTLLLDAVNEDDIESNDFSVDDKFTNFDPVMRVDVDLHISAQMNIKKYFEIKKKSYEKELKTKTATDVAVKDAELHAVKEITKHRQTQKIDRMRKIYWFEKFDWFISSENYLVISGKNAQQNEVLVKRYLNKGDLFMHTDMPGAAVTVIKNPSGQIVPPISLNEAAIFELCHSRAWESKVVTSVYWVHDEQVSKTPPTGLYITTGSFIIRGKRNFITPSKLELGFTIMFTLNEESIANHIGERRPRLQQEEMELQSQMEEMEEDQELLDDGEDGELSRQSSTVPVKEEIQVVQVGEDKELMEKKRQQNFQKKQQLKQKQKVKDDKKSGIKPKVEEPAPLDKNELAKQVRGNKKKLQKIKDKYGDQDEEERQMKLELLGAKKTKGFDQKIKKTHKFIHSLQEENQTISAKQQDEDQQEVEEEQDQVQENIQEAQTYDQNLNQQEDDEKDEELKEEKKDQDEESDKEVVDDQEEKKEIDQLMKEEDINVVAENVDVTEIDKLTGVPKSNDITIGIVPMCAPYSAIQTYKYKVKIQPGTLKRGKAMKLIKSLFLQQANKNQFETTMIKNIPDTDMTNMLVNSCRVLAPGLTKMQNANKQNKKKKQ